MCLNGVFSKEVVKESVYYLCEQRIDIIAT